MFTMCRPIPTPDLATRHSGQWAMIKNVLITEDVSNHLVQQVQLQHTILNGDFNLNFIKLLIVVGIHEINQSTKLLCEFSMCFEKALSCWSEGIKNGLFCLLFIFGMACKKICKLGLAQTLFLSHGIQETKRAFTRESGELLFGYYKMYTPFLFLNFGIKFLAYYHAVVYEKKCDEKFTLFNHDCIPSSLGENFKKQVYVLPPTLLPLIEPEPRLQRAELMISEKTALLPGERDAASARSGCCFCGCLSWLCSCGQ